MNQLINLFAKYGFYFFLGLLALDAVILVWVFILRRNFKSIFKSGSLDLEKILLELREKQNISAGNFDELKRRIEILEEALPKNLRKIGLVRYNPFSGAGGDQSFTLALLNDKDDGLIISSLYGREMNRVYAKPVANGVSQYQLTDEEKEAIQNAK